MIIADCFIAVTQQFFLLCDRYQPRDILLKLGVKMGGKRG